MDQNVHFQCKLARTVFDVRCCFPSTKLRCGDYLLPDSQTPDVRIRITGADIAAESAFRPNPQNQDTPQGISTPESLEILALCRKAAEQLLQYDTVLFHSSALAIDGNGVLFTAPSGTGKSTHAGLWRRVFGQRVVMVNDDKPFVSMGGGEVRVHGSPWRGKHGLGENTSAPVKAICVLYRGEENAIERISPREALPVLLQQTYRPRSPEGLLQAMKLADRLSREAAVYRLFCNMDEEAAWVAYRGITFHDEEDR